MASKDADYETSKFNVQRSDIPTRKLLMTLLAISLGTVIECECRIHASNCPKLQHALCPHGLHKGT
jgi:hypothetical protein